jgi:hypothetical protein
MAPALVLYAQGYRLNLPLEPGKKLIVMTGGLFIKTTPKQADVFVNGKLEEQTDFFFGSALVENLLPRQYQVEVKKTGYQPWEKNLNINEKEVTEARNIILFPAKIGFSIAEKNIDGILLSPDGQKIALRGQNNDIWNLRLYDIAQNVTSSLADEHDFSAKTATFNSWKWANAKTLDISATAGNATSTWEIAIDKNPARIAKITAANPTGASTTVALMPQKNEGGSYFLGQDGFVYKKDALGNTAKISPAQASLKPGTDHGLWAFNNYYFIKNGAELFVLSPNKNSFDKIFDNLSSDPKLSPDGKKVLIFSNSEIWIFFLKDKTDQPAATAGDKIFIARFSEKIADCDWINPDYLIFTAGNAVKAAEIDNRDKANIYDLAKISDISPDAKSNPASQLIWNSNQKTIYLFLDNTLFESQPVE